MGTELPNLSVSGDRAGYKTDVIRRSAQAQAMPLRVSIAPSPPQAPAAAYVFGKGLDKKGHGPIHPRCIYSKQPCSH